MTSKSATSEQSFEKREVSFITAPNGMTNLAIPNSGNVNFNDEKLMEKRIGKKYKYVCNINTGDFGNTVKVKIKTKTEELHKLGIDINFIWNLPQIQATFIKRRWYRYSFPDNMQYFLISYQPFLHGIILRLRRTLLNAGYEQPD
eukprot:188661_1